MHDALHSTAALLWSAAVLLLAGAGIALTIQAKQVAESAARLSLLMAAVAFLLQFAVRHVARAASTIMDDFALSPDRTDYTHADWIRVLFVFLVVAGHLVLAVTLLLRRLRPHAADERAEAERRDRARERPRVPVRAEEVDP